MPGKFIPKETKEEIITKIKSEGITGAEAGRRYGINPNNIYRWLADGIGSGNNQIFEINRLKREIRELKQIIGQLMFDKERGKKN